ncbi:MAG: Uma2 family endonuclease [Chloroflexota bacterium]
MDDLEHIQTATGKDYELVRGELFEVAPPSIRHGETQLQTGRKVAAWAEEHQAGRVLVESGFRLEHDPDTVRGPDVSFVAKGRLTPEQTRRGFPSVAPDLAVEIRSPNDTWDHLDRKAQEYFGAGTKLVIFIEPDTFVELLRPNGERNRLGLDDVIEADDVLPGFRCRVRDLFPKEVE